MAVYLVTGGAGFIGSSIARELVRRGERVRIADNFRSGSEKNLAEIRDQIDLYRLDITKIESRCPAFEGADYVVHLAAIPSVPRSVEDPLTSNRVNVEGTLNVLVASRDAKVKRVVYAASSSAYGDSPTLPKHESMPANPISPYGVSKFAGELYAQVSTRVYGLETVCLRYFNVFGPRQDPTSPYSGVLSLFITAMLEGRCPTIFGDGEQSRDFTYVDNAVQATLLACTAPEAVGKVLNVAMGERHTLNETCAVLQKIIGVETKPIYGPPRSGDILHSHADVGLARQLLGYKPAVSFEEGLRKTVEWYREMGEEFYGAAKG